MDPNTLNCIIAISVVILLVIVVRVVMVMRTRRVKNSNIARMKARQAWTDGYQDRADAKERQAEEE